MSRELLIILITAALVIVIHIGIIYSLRSGFYKSFTKAWTSLQDPWREDRHSIEKLRSELQALQEENNDEIESETG
jgi:F0F1-type ATP synthase membrane subunit b/b'